MVVLKHYKVLQKKLDSCACIWEPEQRVSSVPSRHRQNSSIPIPAPLVELWAYVVLGGCRAFFSSGFRVQV